MDERQLRDVVAHGQPGDGECHVDQRRHDVCVVKWSREGEGFVQGQHVRRSIGYKEMAVEYEPFPLCVGTGYVVAVGEVRPSPVV